MSDASKAVFLSYASQDAEAARRICETLRAAGAEVWFDQSELVGGDQWDQKIRKQIKECALLIPIISAATQARTEGYFRLEWRLADQRTHLMSKGRPFLLPVVIDDTRDADAQVPDSFTEVQWTRLPVRQAQGGPVDETLVAFCARVKKLLGPGLPVGAGLPRDGLAELSQQGSRGKPTPTRKSRLLAGIVSVATIVALAIWQPWRTGEPLPKVVDVPSTIAGQAAASPSDQPRQLSEARKLVARAWEQLNETGRSRAELEMADRLCQQAAELDPDDADVWAAWSQVDIWYYYTNVERTIARKEGASSKAARALRIAPDSYEARLAQACFFVREEPHEKSIFADEAERQLRRLLEERADEPRALFALGILLRNGLRHDEGALVFDRLARQPDFAATALSEKGFLRLFQGRFQEAGECADQSIAFEPFWGNLALKTFVAVDWYGDLDQARDAVERMPAAALMEDYGAGAAYDVYWRRREPDKMLRVLRAVPREWLSSNNLSGPKQFYVGVAHQMAGRPDAARTEWRTALEMLNLRLQTDPNNSEWHFVKAKLLVWLGGNKTEAEEQFRLAQDFAPDDWQKFGVAVERAILSGDVDGAIRVVEQSAKNGLRRVTAAALKTSPMYDPIRADPRFQALLARMEADPRLSPNAGSSAPANRKHVDEKSVAVLAFANLSDDKGNEYFSDGISEELLDVLAKIPGLRVAARMSSFSFKGKSATAQEIGEKLGVATLVEGSVRKSGNSVRISARLSRAETGEQLWSESYTRDLQDVFAVQSELARTIIEQLRGRLGDVGAAAEVKAAVRGGTSNPEAHQQYLQGRYQLNQFSMESFEKALTHFERATTIDPNFALAWAALSRTRVMQTGLASNVTRPQFEAALNEARRAADRALELEPDLPETLNARFEIQFFDFDWKGGAKTMNRALALAPSDAVQLNAASRVAAVFRDHERAVEIARQAVVVDPVNPEVRSNLAAFLLQVRRPVEARAEYLRVAELNPATPWAFAGVGVTYLLEGKYIEAIAASERESAAWAKSLVSAIALWGLHRTAEADAALNEMIKVSADTGAYQIAEVFSFRSEKDQAFAWLDRARRQLDGGLSYYTNDPFLDNLRSDARWAAFQRTMGWADDQLK